MSPPPRWWCCSSLFLLLHFPVPLLAQLAPPQCGALQIPFPFYLNVTGAAPPSSSSVLSPAFSLTCVNSSAVFLAIASRTYRVLHFFTDGVLVDFPNATVCRHYNDLRSFALSPNPYFAISADNVLDLYDCDDSSLCKPDCDKTSVVPGCDGQPAGYPSCCYPLSDRSSSWRPGETLAAFSQYGCRGFSSWVVLPGSKIGKRGVKLEWAVPRNSSAAACAANADVVNATSVDAGVRCQCADGFSGDGFLAGLGCLKSSTLCIVSLTALFLVKRRIKSDDLTISKQPHLQGNNITCRFRLFTYHELEESTKGFGEGQKLAESTAVSTLYTGVLVGGLRVAVQKFHYQSEGESESSEIVAKLEKLSAVSHRNMARIIGWSADAASTPVVVYEYPQNGTLRDHLRCAADDNASLEWHKRLSIAAETASTLTFLHHDSIFHHDLHSGCIFLDPDFSVKLAGFDLRVGDGGESRRRNDVCGIGLLLLEIITGNHTMVECWSANLHKGKVEEMVDPSLYYHEQPPFRREQIEIVVDLATRCLLFGGDGKLGMVDVARELLHVAKQGGDGGSSLEETFSNSSLLQMISMSPDSIYMPGSIH